MPNIIQARSPFYITRTVTGGSGITKLTFKLGMNIDSSAVPTLSGNTANFTIVKNVPTLDTTNVVILDVSPFLKEFFRYLPFTYGDTRLSNNTYGGTVRFGYEILDQNEVSLQTGDYYVQDGYNYFKEGPNPNLPSNGIYLSNNYYVANKDYAFNIGVLNDGTYLGATIGATTYNFTVEDNLTTKVKQMWVYLNTYADGEIVNVIFTAAVGDPVTIQLEVREECKYEPVNVMFLNKFGNYEVFTFFKANQKQIQTKSNTYNANLLVAGSYDSRLHQKQRFNISAKESISMNSGFLPESSNETITQMLLSSHVYIVDVPNNDFIPINITDSSKTLQTRVNDKVINHTIRADYAFDKIQSV
tara:strand:- start:1009 stop:2085 length:1077 start_codon:yes stop_codon:yes gene_type:complete